MESLTEMTSPSLRVSSASVGHTSLAFYQVEVYKDGRKGLYVFLYKVILFKLRIPKVEGSVLLRFPPIPLSWHNAEHTVITTVIIFNNTTAHRALYIVQFVDPNYPQLIMSEGLTYIFRIPLTITFWEKNIFFSNFPHSGPVLSQYK